MNTDKYWKALLDGGSEEQCGWLKDRYGVSWQIVPVALGDMMADPDRERAKRVADAVLKMVKLDLPARRAAYKKRQCDWSRPQEWRTLA